MNLEAAGAFEDILKEEAEPLRKASKHLQGYLFTSGKIVRQQPPKALTEPDYMREIAEELPMRAIKALKHGEQPLAPSSSMDNARLS